MRAITVRQPHAWAIIHGGKFVENRTRNIAGQHRGLVAIHAELADFEKNTPASRRFGELHGTETPTEIWFGAVIGVAELVNVHLCEPGIETDCCHPWGEHEYVETRTMAGEGADQVPVIQHLVLVNRRPLAVPVPARGQLGLWTLTDDVEAQVTAQLKEAA